MPVVAHGDLDARMAQLFADVVKNGFPVLAVLDGLGDHRVA